MRAIFYSENHKGNKILETLRVGGMIIAKWMFKEMGRRVWTGFIWLKIWTSGGLL
jgi:hypothetical protein